MKKTKPLKQDLPLTPFMTIFTERYIATGDKYQSAVDAGYAEGTAAIRARQLLKDPRIIKIVDEGRTKAMEGSILDATAVLDHLAEMMDADIGDILDELGHYKPVHTWPKIWRQMLTGMDIQKIYAGKGADAVQIGEVLKVRFTDRLKALELAGRHVNVNAFKVSDTHIHLHVQEQINDALTEGRARVQAQRSLKDGNIQDQTETEPEDCIEAVEVVEG